MRHRAAFWLAWSLWALTVALTALGLGLLVLILRTPDTHVFEWWVGNSLVVVDVTVGAIVASRRPENPVGWLLCVFGVAVGVNTFAAQYAIYALLARPGSLPAGEAAAWIFSWLLPVMIGLQVFYVLLFPTGRLPGRRWRWMAWLIAAFVVVGAISSAFSVGPLDGLGPIQNPLGVEGFANVYDTTLYVGAPLLFFGAALSVFVRLRRATGVERQQIKWFAYAAAIYASSIVINVVNLAVDTPPWLEQAGTAFFTIAGTGLTVAIGTAILRYRLYDIDILINRTLVYGVLSATLVAVYFGGVTLLQVAFRALTDQGSTLAVVASTLVIAALFNPLRRRIQGVVDRRFYRRKYDAARTLEAFSMKLRDETNLDVLGEDMVEVVRNTVQPAHVNLWLRHADGGIRSEAEERIG